MLLKCVVSYLCVFVCVLLYIDDYYMYFIIMLDIDERAFELMFLVVMPYR